MHDCKDEHERMHDVIAGSPPADPHPPNLQPRGKRIRRAASRSLTSLLPSRYRRRSGLHFSRKRNSFLTVFPPLSRSLSPPCRTYMRSRHGLGIIQSSDQLQYAKNEEHFLRPPRRRRSRDQQRVDAGRRVAPEFDKANGRRPRRRANAELSPRRPFRPVLLRNLGIPLVNELWITTSGQKSRGRRTGCAW